MFDNTERRDGIRETDTVNLASQSESETQEGSTNKCRTSHARYPRNLMKPGVLLLRLHDTLCSPRVCVCIRTLRYEKTFERRKTTYRNLFGTIGPLPSRGDRIQ